MTLDADCVAENVDTEPEFENASASVVEVPGTLGIIANAFEENESDREPSKSISAGFEVAGAAPVGIEAEADKRRVK